MDIIKQYLDLCRHVLDNGAIKQDRTGTGTRSVFGYQMRFDLQDGFPLMTTKDTGDVRLEGIIRELLWFIDGDTNIQTLVKNGINIWNRDAYKQYESLTENPMLYKDFVEEIRNNDDFAKKHGDLGPIYGKQWTDWESKSGNINQIEAVIQSLKSNPDSRRHIVTAWNPSDVPDMALPPCHSLFQFYVADGKLSCQLYQRSADIFLGLPYNIASYALLTMIIARMTGYEYGEFVHTLGDAHIYSNHIEQIQEQLTREPHPLPTLDINMSVDSLYDLAEPVKTIYDFIVSDFTLVDYQSHPVIKGEQSF